AKAERTEGKANPRFVVLSLSREAHEARHLYEKLYCARGEMENRIKECQLDLYADRTSAKTLRANQLRLWFASMAYVLLCAAVRPRQSRRLGWGAQLRGQRQQQLFKNGRALPPGFAGRARRFGGRPMSEHEALARFHYGCAARHHKVEIRRLWRSRCMMHAQRSPLTNIPASTYFF